MIEALIAWSGSIAALGIVCRTFLSVVGSYYRDKEKVRLDRLDRQLQIDSLGQDQGVILERIVSIADTKAYPYQVGEAVIDELVKRKLISSGRADYLRIGARSHRGENS